MKKRVVALFLVLALAVASLMGCGAEKTTEESTPAQTESETKEEVSAEADEGVWEWLDTSVNTVPYSYPLVKEGVEKSLDIWILRGTDWGDADEVWMNQFVEEYLNIDLNVTDITGDEMISLAFAGNELPDIIMGYGFTTSDLVKYGSEGQLLDMAPYVNEKNMPNLYAIYQEYPDYKSAVYDSEGHMWSVGYMSNPYERGNIPRAFLNYEWMEELGLEAPDTLDEFVDVLKAMKADEPGTYPLGGAASLDSPTMYMLNAFGYLTRNASGTEMALRNGTPVLPVADREAYGEYLKLMNSLYAEGIIHPDYYTMDANTYSAYIAGNRLGYLAQAPGVYVADCTDWWGAIPLTSEWNDTAAWPYGAATALSYGKAVVTTACEEPELAMAFIDYFYDEDNSIMSNQGPYADQTELFTDKVKGWDFDEQYNRIHVQYEENKDLYANSNDYLFKEVMLWGFSGLGSAIKLNSDPNSIKYITDPDLSQYEDPSVLRKELTHFDKHFRIALQDTIVNKDYVTADVFPEHVYLNPDDAVYYDNLKSTISEYANQETAKFITGARPLDELDAYFDEIEKLGAKEYVEFYTEYYNSLQ